MKRAAFWTAVAVTGALTPLSCTSAVVLLNMFNPMQSGFIVDFDIVNASDQTIYVTPVGTWGAEGDKSVLPQYSSDSPAITAAKSRNLPIKPGRRRRILYDYDDINFSELVVRYEDGQLRQLVTDPQPTTRQYHPPFEKTYTIPEPDQLPPVRSAVAQAITGEPINLRLEVAMLPLLLPGLVFWGLLAYRSRKARRSAEHNVAQR